MMDWRSCEIPVDELPTVHPGNETSSSEDPVTDTGGQDKEEDNLLEETYGVNSVHPPIQSKTEQTNGPVVKGTVDKRYKCDQGKYSTARKDHLDSHIAKHTGNKPVW
ncbi:hypothetical protein Bbelb_302750 [Branchiostoma belcheri]|nr:hypothetical protein Bbelb_302750 [Branchiostoma belcheri]